LALSLNLILAETITSFILEDGAQRGISFGLILPAGHPLTCQKDT
jgi:hypothetical protein